MRPTQNFIMINAIILYGIANCDTVKKSRAWFDAQGKAYHFHDFKKDGVPEMALREWTQKLGWEALLNKKSTTWRKLDAAQQAAIVDASSAIALMLAHSSVIKRPVVGMSEKLSAGYCPDAWLV